MEVQDSILDGSKGRAMMRLRRGRRVGILQVLKWDLFLFQAKMGAYGCKVEDRDAWSGHFGIKCRL